MSRRVAWRAYAAFGLASSVGHGQTVPNTAAAAEALFAEARVLLDQKRYAEACPKLEESQRLDPAVGTLLYLGLCFEKTSKEASAWSAYRAAESAAAQVGQTERAAIARQRAAQLEPNLARLVIYVPAGNPSTLKVTRDGMAIGRAAWGVAVPLDSGRHVVEATAPGVRAFFAYISIARGQTATVQVASLLPLNAPPSSKTEGPESGSRALSVDSRLAVPGSSQRGVSNVQRWIGFGTATIGLAGLGIGVGLAVNSAWKADDADKYRRPGTNVYVEPGYSLNQQALDSKNAAVVSLVIGGVALAGGVAIYLTAPASSRQRGSVPPTRLLATVNTIALLGHWD